MTLPAQVIEELVDVMTKDSRLDRIEARLVVETANHAATEAMETVARICTALDRPVHVLAALTLSMKVLNMAIGIEAVAVKELVGEMLAQHHRG